MKIGFITTSRADFGIYRPLIDGIIEDESMDYHLFVGGMHVMDKFGSTYKTMEDEGYQIESLRAPLEEDDQAKGISDSMGKVLISYGEIWEKYKDTLDIVFVLGDRFEMFAAVSSLIPFNIPIAHIHGGEETKGAIDNKFRNSISVISDFHFTSSDRHKENVLKITGSQKVYNVGSLGIEAALKAVLLDRKVFEEKYKVNIDEGFVLSTYHPETVDLNNGEKAQELIAAFKKIPMKVLCTLPNADTEGSVIREHLLKYEEDYPSNIACFENLGQKGYYSAIAYCRMMIGNTSSGIIESSAFDKWVIDVGNRQEGRDRGNNVISVSNKSEEIVAAFEALINKNSATFDYPFGRGETALQIIQTLKAELK